MRRPGSSGRPARQSITDSEPYYLVVSYIVHKYIECSKQQHYLLADEPTQAEADVWWCFTFSNIR